MQATLSHMFINFRLHIHTPRSHAAHTYVTKFTFFVWCLSLWFLGMCAVFVHRWKAQQFWNMSQKVDILLRKHIYKNQKKGTGSNLICPFQLVIIVKEVCLSWYICSNWPRRSIYYYELFQIIFLQSSICVLLIMII